MCLRQRGHNDGASTRSERVSEGEEVSQKEREGEGVRRGECDGETELQ
jgi:hypothetical protein